jgi:hypothetical protein
MGCLEYGEDYCFAFGFRTEEEACKWRDDNDHRYTETRLFVERVPNAAELIDVIRGNAA